MSLKLEARFASSLIASLRDAGHKVEIVAPFDDAMGHAGMVIRHANGQLEGASDPRCDGAVSE